MKRNPLIAIIPVLCCANAAYAQDASDNAVASKPEHEMTYNLAVASDYRYRGISQTRLQPALQGGADYVHNPSGLYVGVWASTIKWIKDASGGATTEVDWYAGKRGALTHDIAYDVGVLNYVYPSNALAVNANTTEVYGQLSHGFAYIKYAQALTNLFGFSQSKQSRYLDLGANIELDSGLTLNLHLGRQLVANSSTYHYTDWKLGVTKDFGVVTASLALLGTNAGKSAYASPLTAQFLGKSTVVGVLSKTF